MKKHLLEALAIVLLATGASPARDLAEELWFFNDFDSVPLLDGKAFPWEMTETSRRPGRYGMGCYFHRPARNDLPPMAEFLKDRDAFELPEGAALKALPGGTLELTGPGLAVKARPARVDFHWTSPKTAYTCSLYVRGEAGKTVTLSVALSPADEACLRDAKKNHKDFVPEKAVKDETLPQTCTLTGGWQRVHAWAILDCRLGAGRTAGLRLKTDAPSLQLRKFQFEQTHSYPYLGVTAPALWVDGGKKAESSLLSTSDPELLTGFPFRRGGFSVWFRSVAEDVASNQTFGAFSYCGYWASNWGWQGTLFSTAEKGGFCQAPGVSRKETWQHFAATWSEDALRTYLNGEPIGVVSNPVLQELAPGKARLQLGAFADARACCDLVLDEAAVFKTDLTEEEVRGLYGRGTGLLSGSSRLRTAPVQFTDYFRNQDAAALRFKVYAPAAQACTLRASVGGIALPEKPLALAAGANAIDVPFTARLFRAGSYPWRVQLLGADGTEWLCETGTLAIHPRVERDAFKFLSWGGNQRVSPEFCDRIGINTVNVPAGDILATRRELRHGHFINVNFGNAGDWKALDMDMDAIARKAAETLDYAVGLHTWATTLVNTEAYGASLAEQARTNGKWMEFARRELGHEPDFTFSHAPVEVGFNKKLGLERPADGVLTNRIPALATLDWFMNRGMPLYLSNTSSRKAIHRLSPGNVVWSEPIMSAGMFDDLDMAADWLYDYSVYNILSGLRGQYASLRAGGKPYMPTLGMFGAPQGLHPSPAQTNAAGKPLGVELGQSADVLQIQSWMSIAAVPAANLSMFSADSWEWGVTNALAWLAAGPDSPVKSVAEPDAPARYGTFVKGTLLPAAELLRDMPNARAPVAFLLPSEIAHAGGFWWGHYHYTMAFRRYLAATPVPYDILSDREITPEILRQYKCLILPLARVISPEHDAAIRAAAPSRTLVVDSYCVPPYTNPPVNAVGLNLVYDFKYSDEKLRDPFLAWYSNRYDELRADLPAWSDADGEDSFTFFKEYKGVKYVTVVNNARREGGSFLNRFCTNATFRPCGAPKRIATSFRAAPGAAVYEFVSGGRVKALADRDGVVTLASDFAPAEGKLFCVYPRPLKRLALALEGESRPGKVATLAVTLVDDSGAPAPGRQQITLKLTAPDGTAMDESGRYTLEEGRARIPLRFASSETPGSVWKAEALERTSGLKAKLEFRIE